MIKYRETLLRREKSMASLDSNHTNQIHAASKPAGFTACFISGIIAASLSIVPLFIPLSMIAAAISFIIGLIGWLRFRRIHAVGQIHAGWILSAFSLIICIIWIASYQIIVHMDPTFSWNLGF